MFNQESFLDKDITDCNLLKESKSKKLLVCPIDQNNANKSFLIKIYLYPGLWQKVKYLFRRSKGDKELKLAQDISKKGIPTIVPQKVEDKRKLGILKESLVITEQLPDCLDLEELLLKKRVQDRRLKSKVIVEYAKLARLIHDQGIYQDDFDPNNILYQKRQDGTFQLYFVDFERTKLLKKISFRKRVHSLAKLNRMGRRLKDVDQMRFLKVYLGAQTTKNELSEWIKEIRREEKEVFLRDQRRAERECTSLKNSRIGFINYDPYQGYYRKRYKSKQCYSKHDIIMLLQALEKSCPPELLRQYSPGHIFDLTVKLGNQEEVFQVLFFQYSGLRKHWPRMIKKTPLLSAWNKDHAYLKNRSADYLPVAAVEKKIARNSYYGFLIRKG